MPLTWLYERGARLLGVRAVFAVCHTQAQVSAQQTARESLGTKGTGVDGQTPALPAAPAQANTSLKNLHLSLYTQWSLINTELEQERRGG